MVLTRSAIYNSEIKKSLTTLGANYNFFKDDDLIEKISDDLSIKNNWMVSSRMELCCQN